MFLNWIRAMFWRWRDGRPWPGESARRRAIIKMVAPTFLDAGRSVTPNMIGRFVSETDGLSPLETGRKLRHLVNAEFAESDIGHELVRE